MAGHIHLVVALAGVLLLGCGKQPAEVVASEKQTAIVERSAVSTNRAETSMPFCKKNEPV